MSSEPLSGETRVGWVRPLSLANANHTCNFLAGQILLWSRIMSITGTDIVRISDIIAAVIILSGVVLGFPYVISTFRNSEVVVEGGPSLIRDILPEWGFSALLFGLVLTLFFADRFVECERAGMTAWSLYTLVALVGVVVSIYSATNHKERVLVSVTYLVICLHRLDDFPAHRTQYILSIAFLLSYWIDALDVQVNRELLDVNELSVFRVQMILRVFIALSILFVPWKWLSVILISCLFGSELVLHVYERKFGSVESRSYLSVVPHRESNHS